MTYTNAGGHTVIPTDLQPTTIYTESDLDYINPGQLLTADDGSKHTVLEVRHISGRLYRIGLLPIPAPEPTDEQE